MPELLVDYKFPLNEWNNFISLWRSQFWWHQRVFISASILLVFWCSTFWVLAAVVSMMPYNLIAWFGLVSWLIFFVVYFYKYRPSSKEVIATLTRANDNIFSKLGVVATYHQCDADDLLFETNEVRFRIRSKSALRRHYKKRHPTCSIPSALRHKYSQSMDESSYIGYFRKRDSSTTVTSLALRDVGGASEFRSEITISTPQGDTILTPMDFRNMHLSELETPRSTSQMETPSELRPTNSYEGIPSQQDEEDLQPAYEIPTI